MPHNWVILSNTPPPWDKVSSNPREYRDAIEKTVERYDGHLVHMFWSVCEHKSYALVEGPHDPEKVKAMLRALPSLGLVHMLDHAEAQRAFDHGKDDPGPG